MTPTRPSPILAPAAAALLALHNGAPPSVAQPTPPAPAPTIATLPPSTQFPRPETPPPPAEPEPAGSNPLASAALNLDRIEAWVDWCELAGSSASVLYGVPAPADTAAAAQAGAAILSIIRVTARQIDEGTVEADKRAAAGTASPEEESLLNRAVHARSVLLPLRAARAMLLSAAGERDPERRRRLATEAGKLAAAAEPVAPWADAERSLLRALALLASSDTPETGREAAQAAAAGVATLNEDGAPEALRTELGDDLGFVAVLATARTEPASALAALTTLVDRGPIRSNPAARIAAAEVHLRLRAGTSAPASAPRDAFSGYLLATDAQPDLKSAANVLQRLAAVVGERAPATAPPVARAASCLAALRASPSTATIEGCAAEGGEQPPASRERRLFLAVLAGASPLPPESTPETRLALARALLALSEPPSADAQPHPDRAAAGALALTALAPLPIESVGLVGEQAWLAATDYPVLNSPAPNWSLDDLRLRRALAEPLDQALVTVRDIRSPAHAARAWSILLDRPQRDPAIMSGDRAALTGTAAAAVDDAARRGPGATSTAGAAWPDLLAEAAAFAPLPATAVLPTPDSLSPAGRLRAALARLDAPGVESALTSLGNDPASLAESLATISDRAWARCRSATARFALTPPTPEQASAARVLALTAPRLDAFSEPQRPVARERAALALLISADAPGASRLLEASINAGTPRLDLILALAEAHLANADNPRAFARFREAAAATKPDGEFAADHFHAWARMLQILDRRATTDAEKEEVKRQARRLRTLSPEKTCPPCAEAIEAVARKHAL